MHVAHKMACVCKFAVDVELANRLLSVQECSGQFGMEASELQAQTMRILTLNKW